MATQLIPVSIADCLGELRRELEVRRVLYPTWIRQNRLSQELADFRIQAIELAIGTLEEFEAGHG